MSETDGIEDGFGSSVSMALMLASSGANLVAEARVRQQQDAARRSDLEARQLQERLDAERAAAEAEIRAQTQRPAALDIDAAVHAWELAELWHQDLPELRDQLAQRIHKDLGVDPRDLTEDATATTLVATAAARAEQVDVDGRAAARALDLEPAALDWDSRERRADDAKQMKAAGVPDKAVDAAMTADVANAEPPTSATSGRPVRSKTANRAQPAKAQTPKLQR